MTKAIVISPKPSGIKWERVALYAVRARRRVRDRDDDRPSTRARADAWPRTTRAGDDDIARRCGGARGRGRPHTRAREASRTRGRPWTSLERARARRWGVDATRATGGTDKAIARGVVG